MNYLLDTNAVSEPSKKKPDPVFTAWLDEHQDDCYISVITLMELRYGIERKSAGKRRNELERNFSYLVENFQNAILELHTEVVAEFGRYRVELEDAMGKGAISQLKWQDVLIATQARAFGFTVVTRNLKDFRFVKTLAPWSEEV